MVTRELTNGSILGAEQAVSRKEALRLWTIDSAYLMSADRQQGSIEVGKRADLVVLSENYMTVPSQKIKEIGAIMTVLGGKIVHDTTELGKADVAAAS